MYCVLRTVIYRVARAYPLEDKDPGARVGLDWGVAAGWMHAQLLSTLVWVLLG